MLSPFSHAYTILAFMYFTGMAVYASEPSTFTPAEVEALAKLKPLVLPHLYKDYMKDDYYLLRFLRARNLNVDKAKEMLLESLAWRKEKGIDNVLDADQSELEKQFHKRYIITSDRDGRPAIFFRVGDWKVRRYLLAGGETYTQFIRIIYKIGEIAMQMIRDTAAVNGRNITTGSVVAELGGFNPREHTCLRCIQLYLRFLDHYEKYYPQLGHKAIGINTPRILLSMYHLVEPVISGHTKKLLFVYGFDKPEWRKALLESFTDDQIPVYLGGTYVKT